MTWQFVFGYDRLARESLMLRLGGELTRFAPLVRGLNEDLILSELMHLRVWKCMYIYTQSACVPSVLSIDM